MERFRLDRDGFVAHFAWRLRLAPTLQHDAAPLGDRIAIVAFQSLGRTVLFKTC